MEDHEDRKSPVDRVLEGWLTESLRIDEAVDTAFVNRTLSALDGELASRKERRSHEVVRCGLLLAAACLVVGIVVLSTISSPTPSLRIRVVEGDVFRKQDGRSKGSAGTGLLFEGDPVFPGDELICGPGASLVADYEDGTSIELSGGMMKVESVPMDSGKSLRIDEGKALLHVAEQPVGRKMMFATPHGRGTVLGTVFEVSVQKAITQVRTFSGEVELRGLDAGPDGVPVGAGQVATMGEGRPLVAESFDLQAVGPGDTVWSQEFEERFSPGADIEGRFVSTGEKDMARTILRSIPVEPIHHSSSFRPDDWVSLELYDESALFPVPPEMEVELLIRAEKPEGTIQVALMPEQPVIKAEHVISDRIPVPQNWLRLRLDAADFAPYAESRSLESGLPIKSVALWGFGTGGFSIDRVVVRRKSSDE